MAKFVYYNTSYGEIINSLASESPGATVLSWWDYGSAFELKGLKPVIKDTVSNDTGSSAQKAVSKTINLAVGSSSFPDEEMARKILESTPAFVSPVSSAAAETAKKFNASFVVYDSELFYKLGAINYLYCVYINETSAESAPAISDCEKRLFYEAVYVPALSSDFEYCENVSSGDTVLVSSSANKTYCMNSQGQLFTLEGENVTGVATFQVGESSTGSTDYREFFVVYENSSQAPTDFYKTALYNGLFTGEVDGLEPIFRSEDTTVIAYELSG